MTITEVESISLFDRFSFGAGDRDDEVVAAKVELGEVFLAKWAEDATKAGGKSLEPTNMNVAVFKPVDFFGVVLGGVDGSAREEVANRTENAFGAADRDKPVADNGDFHYLAPSCLKTALTVLRRIWKSRPRDQFLT